MATCCVPPWWWLRSWLVLEWGSSVLESALILGVLLLSSLILESSRFLLCLEPVHFNWSLSVWLALIKSCYKLCAWVDRGVSWNWVMGLCVLGVSWDWAIGRLALAWIDWTALTLPWQAAKDKIGTFHSWTTCSSLDDHENEWVNIN